MNRKVILGCSILAMSLLLLTVITKADEDFTAFYFSDKLTPGAEIKWNVETLKVTEDFQNEIYFNMSNYNLTQGDTIIIKVQTDPNTLPQPEGWYEQDWFDVYVNDILIYDNSTIFYCDFEENGIGTDITESDVIIPLWFIYPSQLQNSTGTYYMHDYIYEIAKYYENHTTESDTDTYGQYRYDYLWTFEFWPEKDNDRVTINWYLFFNMNMTDITNNKVYHSHLEMKLILRVNKDGITDQYYMYVKSESVLPSQTSNLTLNADGAEPENGTVEFSVVREGYNPPGGTGAGGEENTFAIPLPMMAPILGIIATGVVVLKRRK